MPDKNAFLSTFYCCMTFVLPVAVALLVQVDTSLVITLTVDVAFFLYVL